MTIHINIDVYTYVIVLSYQKLSVIYIWISPILNQKELNINQITVYIYLASELKNTVHSTLFCKKKILYFEVEFIFNHRIIFPKVQNNIIINFYFIKFMSVNMF